MASVYPSIGISEVKRFELPCFAASDILANTPVRFASIGDLNVQMVQTSAERPVGIARDFAKAGEPVAVFDFGNLKRVTAGGSFPRQSDVGVVGTSSAVHPESGVTVTYGYIGQLNGSQTSVMGGSQGAVWAVGQAMESAAIADYALIRIDPRLLSGLTAS